MAIPNSPSVRHSLSGAAHSRALVGAVCAMCDEPLEYNFQNERVVEFGCGHVAHGDCFKIIVKDATDDLLVLAQTPTPNGKRTNGNQNVPKIKCPVCDMTIRVDPSQYADLIPKTKTIGIAREEPGLSSGPGENSAKDEKAPTLRSPQYADPAQPRYRTQSSSAVLRSKPSFSSFTAALATRQGQQEQLKLQSLPIFPASLIAENQNLRSIASSSGTAKRSIDAVSTTTTTTASSSPLFSPLLPPPPGPPPIPWNKRLIPDPQVTITAAVPAITRSTEVQCLSCLVHIEIPRSISRDNSINDYTDQSSSILNQPPATLSRRKTVRAKSKIENFTSSDLVCQYLKSRLESVDKYKSLDLTTFGPLLVWGLLGVSYNNAWQTLDCYLFKDYLICVKEKLDYSDGTNNVSPTSAPKTGNFSIKSFVNIRKHLIKVSVTNDNSSLILHLALKDVPRLVLTFRDEDEMRRWRVGFRNFEDKRLASEHSSSGSAASTLPASTPLPSAPPHPSSDQVQQESLQFQYLNAHIPVDLVMVVPDTVRDSKLSLIQSALHFIVESMGNKDRAGLVVYSTHTATNLTGIGLRSKTWEDWNETIAQLSRSSKSSVRASSLVGAQLALDMLRLRTTENPVSVIFLISDTLSSHSPSSDSENLDHCELVKEFSMNARLLSTAVHCFGIGLTHDADDLVEISSSTRGTYTYIKDWMGIPECLAGCLGLVFGLSHKDVKVSVKIPEESPGRIIKVEGCISYALKNSDREAEVSVGDASFGESRDFIVQLALPPHNIHLASGPEDQWDRMMSNLKSIGGEDRQGLPSQPRHRAGLLQQSPIRERPQSVEEVPVLKAEVSFVQFSTAFNDRRHRIRPGALLVILMLHAVDAQDKKRKPSTPAASCDPRLSQRRLELLTAESLQRTLVLVESGKMEKAIELIRRTQTIAQGLSLGALPLPPEPGSDAEAPVRRGTIGGVDPTIVTALNNEMQEVLLHLNDSDMFLRDAKKRILQTVEIILTQRACNTRSSVEAYYAERVENVKKLVAFARDWNRRLSESATNSPD